VLKLIIDHPALAPYLHPEVTGRVPLIVSDHLLEPGGYILMRPSNFMAAVLLAVVALAHLLRLIFGLQVTVADRIIPLWVSAVAFVVAGGMAITLWRGARRR